MRTLVALSLLLPGILLSGCLSDDTTDLASAKAHADLAEAEARAWDEAATFVGLLAVEPADAARLTSEDDAPSYAHALAFTDDPDAGDGLAQSWMYLYNHPDEPKAFAIIIAHDGTIKDTIRITDENVDELDLEGVGDSPAIAQWPVDSDDAARIAWVDPTFAAIAGTPGTTGFITLHHDEVLDAPLWLYHLWNENGDYAKVAIDAVNGTLYTEEDDPRIFLGAPPFEHGKITGRQVTLLDPEDEVEFVLQHQGHHALYVGIDLQDGTPLAELEAVLVGPDGSEHALETSSFFFFNSWPQVLVEAPGPGTWTLQVTAQAGTVEQGFDVHWCTWDGSGEGPSGADVFMTTQLPCEGRDDTARTLALQNVSARFSALSVS